MGKLKRFKNEEELLAERAKLRDDIAGGRVSISEVFKRMRRITGLTQPNFAKTMGIGYRTIVDIEGDKANPRYNTLNKVLEEFGFEVGVKLKDEE